MRDFLQFVDSNSAPNGHSADSHCPTSARIEPPKSTEKDFESKMSTCLTSEFNRAKEAMGRGTACGCSIRQWLKQHWPKVAIHPQKLDYCDTCKRISIESSRLRQILKCYIQSWSSFVAAIQSCEESLSNLEAESKEYRKFASEAVFLHSCAKQWKEIEQLQQKPDKSPADLQDLESKHKRFTLVLSADYQQFPTGDTVNNQDQRITYKRLATISLA